MGRVEGQHISQTSSFPSRDPYQAFRFPEFRRFIVTSFLLTFAILIQEVVIGYELYKVTGDPLVLGLTGLVQAVPFISLTLFGGHIADRFSRRSIILLTIAGMSLASAFLSVFVFCSDESASGTFVFVVYAAFLFIGICRAFEWPAASAIRASLIPVEAYENASTWSSASWQTGTIAGPAISGFLYAWLGLAVTLLVVALLLAGAFLSFLRIPDKPVEAKSTDESFLQSLQQGFRFVFRTKAILYSISLDMFSVLFGGVVAILPVFAQDILHVGAEGLGVLRAAPSIGGVVMLIILSRISVMHHAWRSLLSAVAAFGVCTLVFAVSSWMWLSTLTLFFAGAFDSVSVVVRTTLLQVLTPDEMRGRVNAVNGIFVSTSNELGAFESGVAARLMGTVPSVVFGGVMTLATVGWIYIKSKDLLRAKLV
jgi:MFS family permease